MPCRNGQTVSKRKHGGRLPKFGWLLPSLLCALGCLGVSSEGPGGSCSPCPGNCSCTPAGPQHLCLVNCSHAGLDQAPAASELPRDTHSLHQTPLGPYKVKAASATPNQNHMFHMGSMAQLCRGARALAQSCAQEPITSAN
ncbi:hypothetical protein DNTS_030225 [Danionella cerebrum]|uniref:Uncharacterized protein n=1 Tax=Danionella cerebrum TaxID=2873325 RepID=A0A553Q8D3_9TELE|nr:hypothetical protein DNTS_030225 [Danionella translucida]